MTTSTELLHIVKSTDQDFEWYPTTNEIIDALVKDYKKNPHKSVDEWGRTRPNQNTNPMKTNPYVTPCSLCGHPIPANGGIITDTGPQHLICRSNQRASVGAVSLEGATTLLRASDGPCEDAPCCGCCGTVDTSTLTFSEDGMAALFAPDGQSRRPEPSAPLDLDQLSDDDLFEHEFAEVIVPDGIELDGRLGAAEDDLEERFHVRERTKGAFTLAICSEYGRLVVRIFAIG